MPRKTMAALLAATALAFTAPAAQADAPVRTCRFYATSTDGLNFSGVAAGIVTHGTTDDVTIRCYVTVNGDEVDSTIAGTGIGTAVTAGQVEFAATPFESVHLCTELSTEHGPQTECFETTLQTDPSPNVVGLVCGVTSIIGTLGFDILGLVVIEPDGDVYVATVRVLNCEDAFPEQPVAVRFG